MKKLTDAEVVKALEICTDKLTISCPNDCPFYDECENDLCALERHALELIKLKDAHITSLKKANKEMFIRARELYKKIEKLVSADEVIGFRDAEIERLKEAYLVYEETTGLKQAKSEAYKEFAERLKQVFWNNNIFETCIRLIADNILKELTEGSGCNGQDHEG